MHEGFILHVQTAIVTRNASKLTQILFEVKLSIMFGKIDLCIPTMQESRDE